MSESVKSGKKGKVFNIVVVVVAVLLIGTALFTNRYRGSRNAVVADSDTTVAIQPQTDTIFVNCVAADTACTAVDSTAVDSTKVK